MRRMLAMGMTISLLLTLLTSCETSEADASDAPEVTSGLTTMSADQIKVGFVYAGARDAGDTYAHDEGRKVLEAELNVKTLFAENVPATEACVQSMRDLIDQGCHVIVAANAAFDEFTRQAAAEYTQVYFFQCGGSSTADNLSVFDARTYQAQYLAGIAAGMRTETDRVGVVGTQTGAETLRDINAFSLGVQAANPEASVEVRWVYSPGPSSEMTTAGQLIDKGCDVVAQVPAGTSALQAATADNVWGVGDGSSTTRYNDACLTSPVRHWGSYYITQIKHIINGTWAPSDVWGGIETGMVGLDELSDNCALGTRETVDAAYNRLVAGEDFIFTGTIYDNTHILRAGEGIQLTDEELKGIDWLNENITGTAPR